MSVSTELKINSAVNVYRAFASTVKFCFDVKPDAWIKKKALMRILIKELGKDLEKQGFKAELGKIKGWRKPVNKLLYAMLRDGLMEFKCDADKKNPCWKLSDKGWSVCKTLLID